jgi:UDP-glucose 6-dehydrogenase
MICFLGTSHAASHLRAAAKKRGNWLINDPDKAQVVFISEDTPTDEYGNRDLEPILKLIERAKQASAQIVLTSQVPPGFTRSLGIENIFHQAETLRIIDAEKRAYSPEYIAVGGDHRINTAYANYLASFQCPVLRMTWEEAEFSKIAVNMFLAAQVDTTNRLSAAASKVGAKWEAVSEALRSDSRIGEHAYLTPGRWQDSKHLLRDAITLQGIECTVATI